MIEVGVVFYAASLAAAAAIGWFTRAVFLFRCKHCGRVVPVVAPQQQRLLDGPSSSRNGAPSAEGAAAKSAARRYPAVFRQQMVELVRSGRTPEDLAREFEPAAQTIRTWVTQAARLRWRAH